jgi:hypothetical protein
MAKEKKSKYTVGYTPTVNLLSGEYIDKRELGGTKKRAIKFVGTVAVFAALAAAVPGGMAALKFFELSQINSQVADLKVQQLQYSDVLDKQNTASSIEAARAGITAGEVNWATFINNLDGAMGNDADLLSIAVSSTSDPVATAASGGTFVFAAPLEVTDLNTLPAIRARFLELPGAVDILFESASGTGTDGEVYSVAATLSFNDDILWNRFNATAQASAETAAQPDGE